MTNTPLFQIQPLDPVKHDRSDFDCGEPAQNNFLRITAARAARGGGTTSITYVLVDLAAPPTSSGLQKILGYYCLSACHVELTTAPLSAKELKRLGGLNPIPCTLLGQLAVDLSMQGQKLGGALLTDAGIRSAKAALQVASFALVLDAANPRAEAIYKKTGFAPMPTVPGRFFRPLSHYAAALVAAPPSPQQTP